MDSIFISRTPDENIKTGKEKIDGDVGTGMSLDRTIRCWTDNTEPVYD